MALLDSIQHINDSLQIAVYKTETDKLISKVDQLQSSQETIFTAFYTMVGLFLTGVVTAQLWNSYRQRKIEKEALRNTILDLKKDVKKELDDILPVEFVNELKALSIDFKKTKISFLVTQMNILNKDITGNLFYNQDSTFEKYFMQLRYTVEIRKATNKPNRNLGIVLNNIYSYLSNANKASIVTNNEIDIDWLLSEDSDLDTSSIPATIAPIGNVKKITIFIEYLKNNEILQTEYKEITDKIIKLIEDKKIEAK